MHPPVDPTEEDMALLESSTIRRAVDNVATWGDTDIFPFPIENHIMHDEPEKVSALIAEIAKDFDNRINTQPVQSYSTLSPVGYTGFRWATQIEPIWNAYMLSLAISMAPQIEQERLPDDVVFSYRFQSTPPDSLFNLEGWKRFQDKSRELAASHKFVVSVDIADFYSRIYHHPLENSLRRIDPGATRTQHVMALLGKLSNNTSYGLPVGGPAARIFSELLLNRVDHLIAAERSLTPFCRYADDYRFFVNDLQTAYRAIGFLSEKLLRNEGLSLQKGKTRVMTSPEYLGMLDPPNPPAGSAGKFLGLHVHFDPYSPTAVEDYERLKAQMNEFDILSLLRNELNKGRIHAALTRRLIGAIQFIDEPSRQQAVISLLESIDTLAPVIPQVMMAVRKYTDDAANPDLAEPVVRRVHDLVKASHYASRIDLNLSYMVRVLAGHHTLDNEQLLIQLYGSPHGFGGGLSPNIQRDIMLALARWGVTYWVSDQKNYVGSVHPWVRRAFVVASYVLGDEGKHWREANKATMSVFDLIVRDWAAKKTQVAGWRIPI